MPAQFVDEGTFVGRQEDLGVLQHALADVTDGRSRVMLVEGAPGIGKTALVREFVARHADTTHLWVSGDETETSVRFGVVDQIREAVQRSHIARTDRADSFAIGTELIQVIGELHGQTPVILVVDDLHWADQDSCRALLFCLRRLRHDAILVICIARPGVDDVLGTSWARLLADTGRCARLRIAGLSAGEVGLLARQHDVTLTAAAAHRLRDHTAGNALYTVGLLAELDEGTLNDPARMLPAPHSYAATVLARVSRLSPAARDLVAAAAVLGTRSALRATLATAGLSAGTPALDEVVAHDLLVNRQRVGVREVQFTHPLVRAAVYDDLSPSRRRALHLAAAAVLGPLPALAHVVAATDGNDPALAMELEATAERELQTGAVRDAAQHLFWSAELDDDEVRGQDNLLRGIELLLLAGDVAGAHARADAVRTLPRTPHQRYVAAALAAAAGELGGAIEQFRALATPALAEADPRLFAQLTASLSVVECLIGDGEQAVHHARESLRTGLTRGPSAAAARQSLALGLGECGRADEGLAGIGEMSADSLAPEPFAADQVQSRAELRLWRGDAAGAARDLRAVIRWVKAGEALMSPPAAYALLADAEFDLGEWDDAINHAELAASLGRDLDHVWNLAYAHGVAARVYALRGRFDFAAAHVELARAAARAVPSSVGRAHAHIAAAAVALARRDWGAAEEALTPLREHLDADAHHHPALAGWLCLDAEANLGAGRTARAGAALDRLAARAAGRPRSDTERLRLTAAVRAAQGQTDAAQTTLANCLRRGTAPFARARSGLDLGRLLLAAGQRDAARRPLTDVRGVLAQLGAVALLAQCDEALADCGIPDVPALEQRLDGLTSREQIVARLVTRGLTNREVAAELFVSAKTIEYHLRNIFAKLGVSTRRELWRAADPDARFPPVYGGRP